MEKLCKCFLYGDETACYSEIILKNAAPKKQPLKSTDRRKLKKIQHLQKDKRKKRFMYDMNTHCNRLGGFLPLVTRPDSKAPLPFPTKLQSKSTSALPSPRKLQMKGKVLKPIEQLNSPLASKQPTKGKQKAKGKQNMKGKKKQLPKTLEERMAMFNLSPATLHQAAPGRIKLGSITNPVEDEENPSPSDIPQKSKARWSPDSEPAQPADLSDPEAVPSEFNQEELSMVGGLEMNLTLEINEADDGKQSEGSMSLDSELQDLLPTTSLDPRFIGGHIDGSSPPPGANRFSSPRSGYSSPQTQSSDLLMDLSRGVEDFRLQKDNASVRSTSRRGEHNWGDDLSDVCSIRTVDTALSSVVSNQDDAKSIDTSPRPPPRLLTASAEKGDPTAYQDAQRGLGHLASGGGDEFERGIDTILFQSWEKLPWQARMCPSALEAQDKVRLVQAIKEEEQRVTKWRQKQQQRAKKQAAKVERKIAQWLKWEQSMPLGPEHKSIEREAKEEEAFLQKIAVQLIADGNCSMKQIMESLDNYENELMVRMWELHLNLLNAVLGCNNPNSEDKTTKPDACRLVAAQDETIVKDNHGWSTLGAKSHQLVNVRLVERVRQCVWDIEQVRAILWLKTCGVSAILATNAKEKTLALLREDMMEYQRVEQSAETATAWVKNAWQKEVMSMEAVLAQENTRRTTWEETQEAVIRAVSAHICKLLTPASLGGLGAVGAPKAPDPTGTDGNGKAQRLAVLSRCRKVLASFSKRREVAQAQARVVQDSWSKALEQWRDQVKDRVRGHRKRLLEAVNERKHVDEVEPVKHSQARLRAMRQSMKHEGMDDRLDACKVCLGTCLPLWRRMCELGVDGDLSSPWFAQIVDLDEHLKNFQATLNQRLASQLDKACATYQELEACLDTMNKDFTRETTNAEETERCRVRDSEAAERLRVGELESSLAEFAIETLQDKLARTRMYLALGTLQSKADFDRNRLFESQNIREQLQDMLESEAICASSLASMAKQAALRWAEKRSEVAKSEFEAQSKKVASTTLEVKQSFDTFIDEVKDMHREFCLDAEQQVKVYLSTHDTELNGFLASTLDVQSQVFRDTASESEDDIIADALEYLSLFKANGESHSQQRYFTKAAPSTEAKMDLHQSDGSEDHQGFKSLNESRCRRAHKFWRRHGELLKGLLVRVLERAEASKEEVIQKARQEQLTWGKLLHEQVADLGMQEQARFERKRESEAKRVDWKRKAEASAGSVFARLLQDQAAKEAEVARWLSDETLGLHQRMKEKWLQHERDISQMAIEVSKETQVHFQNPNNTLNENAAFSEKILEKEAKAFDSNRRILEEWEQIRDSFWEDAKRWHEDVVVDLQHMKEDYVKKLQDWVQSVHEKAVNYGGNAYVEEEKAIADFLQDRRCNLATWRENNANSLIQKEMKAIQQYIDEDFLKAKGRIWQMLTTMSLRNLMDSMIITLQYRQRTEKTEEEKVQEQSEEEQDTPIPSPRSFSVNLSLEHGASIAALPVPSASPKFSMARKNSKKIILENLSRRSSSSYSSNEDNSANTSPTQKSKKRVKSVFSFVSSLKSPLRSGRTFSYSSSSNASENL